MSEKILVSIVSVFIGIISMIMRNIKPFKSINKQLNSISSEIKKIEETNKIEHLSLTKDIQEMATYILREKKKEHKMSYYENEFSQSLNAITEEYNALKEEKVKTFALSKGYTFVNFAMRVLRKIKQKENIEFVALINSAITASESTKQRGIELLPEFFVSQFFKAHDKTTNFMMARLESILTDKINNKQERTFNLFLGFLNDFLVKILIDWEEYESNKDRTEEIFFTSNTTETSTEFVQKQTKDIPTPKKSNFNEQEKKVLKKMFNRSEVERTNPLRLTKKQERGL